MADVILSELLAYDPTSKSGLRWKVGRGGIIAGSEAGTLWIKPSTGYRSWVVKVGGRRIYAHRIVYELAFGVAVPSLMQIDHIDGDALNDHSGNLRVVTGEINSRNKRARKCSLNEVVGVSYDAQNNGYRASYYEIAGKLRRKFFSCKKYGQEAAFSLAKQWRGARMAEINLLGAGYTDRHIGAVTSPASQALIEPIEI